MLHCTPKLYFFAYYAVQTYTIPLRRTALVGARCCIERMLKAVVLWPAAVEEGVPD